MAFYSKLRVFNVKSYISAAFRGVSSEAAGKKVTFCSINEAVLG